MKSTSAVEMSIQAVLPESNAKSMSLLASRGDGRRQDPAFMFREGFWHGPPA
jgi:hypothetical protein